MRVFLNVHMAHDSDAGHVDQWQTQEEWELLDNVPGFTIGDGLHRVTFWSSLASFNPVLRHRTPEEMQSHAAALITERHCLTVGREPKLIRSAYRRADGAWVGVINDHTRTVNVASEGKLISGVSFVESLTGEIFQVELLQEKSSSNSKHMERASADSVQSAPLPVGSCPHEVPSTRTFEGDLPRFTSAFTSLGWSTLHAYVSVLATCVLLIGGQLATLGLHEATPAAVRASWQKERVLEAHNEVVQLERWLESRREAFSADQETFIRRMGELEPRLRASEMRLYELEADAHG